MLKESGKLVGARTRIESQDLPAIPFRKPRRPYSLVTGGSQGLGRALAEECARLGMNLILVDLPCTGLPEISKELASRYHVAVVFRETDLLEPDSIKAIYRWIGNQKLPVPMLVNNAGIGCHGSFVDSQPERNQAMINLNIAALVHLTHIFLPELRAHDRSYILNVASLAAFYPMPFKPVYAPTKAFVLNFSLALRGTDRDIRQGQCTLSRRNHDQRGVPEADRGSRVFRQDLLPLPRGGGPLRHSAYVAE